MNMATVAMVNDSEKHLEKAHSNEVACQSTRHAVYKNRKVCEVMKYSRFSGSINENGVLVLVLVCGNEIPIS